jgi:hypothetical protein
VLEAKNSAEFLRNIGIGAAAGYVFSCLLEALQRKAHRGWRSW